ncbi:MAG: hypothetical protein GF364_05585 [Candidatus Lokiarchaeota archaeon]|nr:hypothetical protein [Candidatus Lokiarchaeota archaeon]
MKTRKRNHPRSAIILIIFAILSISALSIASHFFLYNLFIYPYNFPFYALMVTLVVLIAGTSISYGIKTIKIKKNNYVPTKRQFLLMICFNITCLFFLIIYSVESLIINADQLISDIGYELYVGGAILVAGGVIWSLYDVILNLIILSRDGSMSLISRFKYRIRNSNPYLTNSEISYLIKQTTRIKVAFLLTILVCTALGVGAVFLTGNQRCYYGSRDFSESNYDLPETHYNSSLDLLAGTDLEILEALEIGLWRFTTLQSSGGFPLGSSMDGTLMWSDRGKGCPLFPGEFSIQQGTPPVGDLYLKMYHLEPNPIYLNVAKAAADALIAVQDEVNGGFYHEGRRYPDGSGYQPHPHNIRRAAVLDDDTMQSAMRFLLNIYNITASSTYLNAINKGFECIFNMEKDTGGWPQKSNYGRNAYEHYVTLNDDAFYRVFMLLLKAHDMFADRTEFLDAAKRACQFLVRVQGNGGSKDQKGWSQQYNDQDLPAWARSFEPPAICSSQTARAIDMLIEIFLYTNESSWLNPIPEAIEWLNSTDTRLTGDLWARLYELKTNNPIYGLERGGPYKNPKYVYDFDSARPGYSWQGNYGISFTMTKWLKLKEFEYNVTDFQEWVRTPASISYLEDRAIGALNTQNDDGWWLVGNEIIDTMFVNNAGAMIDYLKAII